MEKQSDAIALSTDDKSFEETKATIFGIEFKKFKKKFSVWTLLLSLPFLSIFTLYFAFGVDITRKTGLAKMWRQYAGSDDLLLFAMIVPLIALPFSLLHYKSRESVYKVWLGYSLLGLVLFISALIMYIVDPPGSAGVVSLDGIEFILLGIAYVAGSLLIWLYGAITHFFRKK